MLPEQEAGFERFTTNHWSNCYALTLGLRWRSRDNELITLSSKSGPPSAYVQNFRHFTNVLSRAFFRGAARNGLKRVRIMSVFEQDRSDRFHIHAAIERPQHVTHSEFCDEISRIWTNTRWGHKHLEITPEADDGWTKYMLKRRSKANWFDAIDWENFHNPLPADA